MAVDGFERAWSRATRIPGWLTAAQARCLWDSACSAVRSDDAAEDPVLEIGSHQGRSTVVLASALAEAGVDTPVVAVDPFIAGGMFGGPPTRARFESNVESAGMGDRVELVAEKSGDLRPNWFRPLCMLYIDGKHDYWTVRDDLRWVEHVRPGGPVLIHDAFSSIGVTLALLVHVLPGSALTYTGRVGSLATFTAGRPALRDRLRILAEVPWWLRNVLIKLVLRAGRLVGYRRPDPF